MTLRRRLLGLISLMLLVSVAFGSLLTYWHAQKKVAVEMAAAISVGERSTHDAAEVLSKSTEPARQLQRIVAAFNGDRHLRASWIGPTGVAIAESRVLPPAEPLPGWFYAIFAGRTHERTLDLPAKVADMGRIRLETDSRNEVAEVWEDLSLKAMIVLAFSATLLGLVFVTLDRALRPLDALSLALGRVGQGDYDAQVSVDGPLELATIYKQFNSMAEQMSATERQNRRLNEQLAKVQEEERADIARDLHDEFGPFLFSIDVDARTLKSGGIAEGDVQRTSDAIRSSVAHLQKHLRSMLGRLRPAALLDLGLLDALDHLVGFWRARHPGIEFSLQMKSASYGRRIDDVLYRVVQESLSNAVRHGNPRRIEVVFAETASGEAIVTVTDDGVGLAPDRTRGFGLVGMRERVASLGGEVDIGQRPQGPGVRVEVRIPHALQDAA